jgi:hypothetical protein
VAAGCTSLSPATANESAPVSSQNLSVPPPGLQISFFMYDRNRDGKLDAGELAAMAHHQRSDNTVVLQAYGVFSRGTPAQTKVWIDHQIASETKKESVDPAAGPHSEENWKEFWTLTIGGFRSPRQIGGSPDPNAEE